LFSALPPTPGVSCVKNWGSLLREELAAGAAEPTCRAVQHVDRPGKGDVADILVADADGQVSEAVLVEVTGRQRIAEVVLRFGAISHAQGVLGEQRATGAAEAVRQAIQQDDRPGVDDAAKALERAPTARSAKPSWLKSPAASEKPKRSLFSALLATPEVFWVKYWLPLPLSPPAEPYSTLTAPAKVMSPTPSPGAPTARSAKPS
jgi:hypothetical protein